MKKVTAMLFSMAVGLNAVSMAAKAKASEEQETDVLLIGGGIMSATLGTYLRELEPEWSMTMVERLEGVCSENDWQRAYNEINEFEKELAEWGAVVIKFWVQIDNQTQLERFTDRQNTPEKQWKITDEDWRNREKWDQYEEAVNEMLQKTNTTFAPWYILESNDKKYARIKALRIVVESLKKACKEQEK